MKSKGNSTIVDIAERAGVTNITVSRTFNRPELVRPETREKILEIAKELNYVPNAFARNLKNNQSKIVGVVTDSTFNPVYANILKQLCTMADERGFTVMIFETSGSQEAENRAIQTLFSHKASGILLSAVSDSESYTPDYLELAKAYSIPIVLFDRDIPGSDLPGVFLNNVEIGVRAGKHLSKQGFKSFLICGGPSESEITQDRISGLIGGLRANASSVTTVYSGYQFDLAFPVIREHFSALDTTPECIIGINGDITLAALRTLSELGLRDSISVFSIDEAPYSDVYGVHVPCISHHPKDWGEKVGKLLFSVIDGDDTQQRIYIESELIS